MQAAHIIEDVQGFERRPKRNDLPIWARYANGEMALVGKLRHQHLAANFPSNVFSAPAEGFDPRAAVKEHGYRSTLGPFWRFGSISAWPFLLNRQAGNDDLA